MGIVTKRNGKILMMLGVLLVVIGFLGVLFMPPDVYRGQFEQTGRYPWYTIILTQMIVTIGPSIAVVGIPLFIVGARRIPSRLMQTLKGEMDIRTRCSIGFLAQQLGIKEKDVRSTISRLRSNGEPISIDVSTSEVVYDPALSPPSTKIKKPSMTSYEKVTVIFTILSILITILIAFLK